MNAMTSVETKTIKSFSTLRSLANRSIKFVQTRLNCTILCHDALHCSSLHCTTLHGTTLHCTCSKAAVIAVSAMAATSIFILLIGAFRALAASCRGLRKDPARGEKDGKSSCRVLLEVLLACDGMGREEKRWEE